MCLDSGTSDDDQVCVWTQVKMTTAHLLPNVWQMNINDLRFSRLEFEHATLHIQDERSKHLTFHPRGPRETILRK